MAIGKTRIPLSGYSRVEQKNIKKVPLDNENVTSKLRTLTVLVDEISNAESVNNKKMMKVRPSKKITDDKLAHIAVPNQYEERFGRKAYN